MAEKGRRELLKGQATLVTGANSGIGEAIAKAMAAEGANVVVNYVTHEEEAEQVVREIRDAHGQAVAVKADVSKEDQVQKMFKAMYREYGTIDVLVNNAGVQIRLAQDFGSPSK